jgi:hypothetical protein
MCLTDATKLISVDPKNKTHKTALTALKKKLATRKKELQAQVNDLDRGLQKIDKHLGRFRK